MAAPTTMFSRRWQGPFVLGALVLFIIYSVLLYGRPAWKSEADPGRKTASGRPGEPSRFGWLDKTPGGEGSGGAKEAFFFRSNRAVKHPPSDFHPIDRLIEDGHTYFRALLGKRSLTLEQAASRYRERRGRHPPPGFDAWFAYAQKWRAVVVEDFFDRIHQDLAPLWALEPRTMRRQTHSQPQLIRVRGGRSHFETDNPHRPPWIQHWGALLEEIAEHLPDLDMVVNIMDETRLLVPWETVAGYVAVEQASRRLRRPADTLGVYSGLADVDDPTRPTTPYQHSWIQNDANRFWDHLRAACPPDSPSRNVSALPAFDQAIEYPTGPNAAYTWQGYVANATAARDPCWQPHLRGMHGTFVESVSMSTSHDLLPMFAGCKLPQNNEILIPGAMYLTEDPFYSGGAGHGGDWATKKPGLVWRGTASGGRNKADNWWHFHRHRWVQMTNGTTVGAVARGEAAAGPTFALPREAAAVYFGDGNATAAIDGLGAWVASLSDVGFVDLECFPAQHRDVAVHNDKDGTVHTEHQRVLTCDYTSPHMAVLAGLPMQAQYEYRFLPDVDGNSYSARWRGFLRSSSVPLKATIYAEWHDDRLVPWVHYVPFDSSYMDLYGIMDYFLRRGRDAEAERIAMESRLWAEAVLRREDMRLYVWLLLLEYARVVDDERDRLAFVGDLMTE